MAIVKDYSCKRVSIPHKRPKNGELSAAEKEENTTLANARIYVGHSIGGMKRYRILSDRLRIHDIGLYNDALAVCAGLWNFYITN